MNSEKIILTAGVVGRVSDPARRLRESAYSSSENQHVAWNETERRLMTGIKNLLCKYDDWVNALFVRSKTPWLLLAGCIFGLLLICFLQQSGGLLPIDDSYISLSFARNMHRYQEISYNQGELSTGITCPLFSGLIALLYCFVQDWIAASLGAGLIAFVIAAAGGYTICRMLWSSHAGVAPVVNRRGTQGVTEVPMAPRS